MSKTELAILGLLSERPMHGYEIKQTVKDRWMDMWAFISLPSIYNSLNRLSDEDYISEHKEKIGKTPERNVYSISEKGKERLVQLMNKGLAGIDYKELPFWLAFAFAEQAHIETLLDSLNKRLIHMQNCCDDLEKTRNLHKERMPYHWSILSEKGLESMKLEVRQLKKVIDHYTAKVKNQRN